MVSAGRVLIIPKGAYNPATTYEMLDLVSYNGSSYIAKTTTTGNLPTDTTYWQLSAYGGQAANIAGNFAEIETSSIATSVHYENDIFVDENSQLMKATQTINIGDTIDENTNCTPTTVEALISYLSSYVDSLDSLNKKIQGAIEIAAQTDLHSLAIGEYYKKQSTFYITNGPTGIDQDPTAIFRLTVEAALDNASQANSPLLLTLRTLDGKIYTQSFDGTTWESWEEIANESSVANVAAELATKQNITDSTLQTTSKTVPGAINELNEAIANEVGKGGLNNFNVDGYTSLVHLGVSNKQITNKTADNRNVFNFRLDALNSSGQRISILATQNGINATGNYTFDVTIPSGTVALKLLHSGGTYDFTGIFPIDVLPSDYKFGMHVAGYDCSTIGGLVVDSVFLTLKSLYAVNSTYAPYAMTNRELTEVKTGTISLESSTYIDSYNDQSLLKVGNLCIFNYNFVLKTTAASDVTVFSLSEKPTNTVRFRMATQNDTKPLDIQITTDGNVQVYQGVANTRYKGQLVFFTK